MIKGGVRITNPSCCPHDVFHVKNMHYSVKNVHHEKFGQRVNFDVTLGHFWSG